MVNKRKSPPGPTDPPLAKAKKRTTGLKENEVPIRRSGRATKGQGGELQQKQTVSEAVQPRQGLPKQKKSHVQDIPNDVMVNPMAPKPPKRRSKRSKANAFPTPSQDMPMPTVPRPLSYIAPSRAEPNLNNRDSRFGFRLPPQPRMQDVSPLVAGSFDPFPGSPVTGVSLLASVSDADAGGVPIDPVLLAESQSQSSLRPPPVVYHSSSSQVHQRQGLTPLLPGQNPFTGGRSKGQVTDIDIHANDSLDSNSEDDSEDSRVDKFGVEYESDDSDSDDGSEPALPSCSKAHVRNSFPVNAQDQDPDDSYDLHDSHDNAKNPDNAGEPNNDGHQDIGIEHSTHHNHQDPLLVAGFDRSPSEDERFFQAQLRSPSEPVTQNAQTSVNTVEGNDSYDVVGQYYRRNRAPLPPDPIQLEKIRSQNSRDASVETDVSGEQHSEASMGDNEGKVRAKRHSQKSYTKSTDDPNKLSFYPPQWRDVLARAQILWRRWIALECGFPERQTKAHLDKAMQCIIDALSEHQGNGGRVENGFWRYQNNMRRYIFADQSAFRGTIKSKAAEIVRLHYHFYPDTSFNNQNEETEFISTAIRELIKKGIFLRGKPDEMGRTSNFTHPAVKELSIFIYKLAAPSLSGEFQNRMPCSTIALAVSAIRCCLEAWASGRETRIDFTAERYKRVYNVSLGFMKKIKDEPYHWKKFSAARRDWAEEAKSQTRPNVGLEEMDMEICLD